jgi:two-component system nitrate/nitrite response regulator NarL
MTLEQSPITLVVADARPSHRRRCRILAEECGLQLLGEAAEGETAAALILALRPQVLLLNLALPLRHVVDRVIVDGSGNNQLCTVAVLPSAQKEHVIDALRLNARGVIACNSTADDLSDVLRKVRSGDYCFDPAAIAITVTVLRDLLVSETAPLTAPECGLTLREIEIVKQIGQGLSNRMVGRVFSISERTVKHHLTRIFRKVGVSNRVELALFAANHVFTSRPVPPEGTTLRSRYLVSGASS